MNRKVPSAPPAAGPSANVSRSCPVHACSCHPHGHGVAADAEIWAMIVRHLSLVLLVCSFCSIAYAQAPPDGTEAEVAKLHSMTRELPPAAVLHYVDSVLALPAIDKNPKWCMELHSAKGTALRFMRKHHEALAEHDRAFELADSLQDA